MPFFPEGYSTGFDKENTASGSLHESTAAKAALSTASSSLSSTTRSSLNTLSSDLMASSPSTSHTSSIGRTTMSADVSPLRPSRAANVKQRNANFVPNSEPNSPAKVVHDAPSDIEVDDAHDVQSQPNSPNASSSSRLMHDSPTRVQPQAYVQITPHAPSEKRIAREPASKRKKADVSGLERDSHVMDDAALAAALAREEAMSVRRSARSSRGNVAYAPAFDAEGRPLPANAKPPASARESKHKKARTRRSFSDDEEEAEHADEATNTATVKVQTRTRIESETEEGDDGVMQRRASRRGKHTEAAKESDDHRRITRRKDEQISDAPTESVSKKSRKSKAQIASEAAKADVHDTGLDADDASKAPADDTRSDDTKAMEQSAVSQAGISTKSDGDQASHVQERAPHTAVGSDRGTFSDPPASVNIKRISDNCGTLTSSARSSPTPSGTRSPGLTPFYGKPLTSLLNSGAARRPGLTRKTNIPSLLNHRGAPKARIVQLAASKRKMQDDDYEYDAAYEAMIAKNANNSDSEDEAAPYLQRDEDHALEVEVHDDVEYD